ncbi:hydantoinase B/oxoprolinase family protein, partial [Actinoallomurus acaciae]
RGGCGLELTFRARPSGSRLLARGLERMRFRPWGTRGGRPGVPARLVLNAGTPRERVLEKIDVLELEDGDVVTLLTSGAGGYGDPLLRDADAVLADVRRGVVSPEGARRDYGVVIVDGPAVDEEATRRERASRSGPAEPGAEFGPERLAWESVFSVELVDRLVAALFRLPAARRSRLRAGVYAEVLADLPPGFGREPLEPARAETARKRLVDKIVELERMAP